MMAAMTETVGDRKLSDGRAPFSDHLSARGFNAETSDILDCSKTLVHDLLKVQPCETPKEQDMSAMQTCIAAADSIGMKTLQHIVESLETRLQSALMHAVMQVLEPLGKEAAARVVMAERKAKIMEQEHINTKQQALAMMLRIKHSSDFMLVDAEKRLRLEQRRSQELDAKVCNLQDKIRRLQVELKRKGDFLEEMQKQSQLDPGVRSGMTSPCEGILKKRKGSPSVRPIEVKFVQRCDEFLEDECNDTATVLTPHTDEPNSVLGRGLVQFTPQNLSVQESSRAALTDNRQGPPASLLKHLGDGSAPRLSDKEINSLAASTAEQNNTLAGSKSTGEKSDVEEDLDSNDQHESRSQGLFQTADKKALSTHASSANKEDVEVNDDGFQRLIALQGVAPMDMPDLQNGDSISGLKLEVGAEADADNDSSTDDEEECQFKQRNASRNAQPKSPVVTGLHDVVPGTTNEIASKSSLVEQAVVLRRCSTGRRGKQQFSPEKLGALLLKEKEEKASGYSKGAESNALAKSKGGSVDGSSNLLMESSRDSRRLMQGARQLLSLRKL